VNKSSEDLFKRPDRRPRRHEGLFSFMREQSQNAATGAQALA
jgi:hypothetical protein